MGRWAETTILLSPILVLPQPTQAPLRIFSDARRGKFPAFLRKNSNRLQEHVESRRLVLPKFEPGPLRTGPKFSSKFGTFAELDLKFSSGFSQIKKVQTWVKLWTDSSASCYPRPVFFAFFSKNFFQFLISTRVRCDWQEQYNQTHLNARQYQQTDIFHDSVMPSLHIIQCQSNVSIASLFPASIVAMFVAELIVICFVFCKSAAIRSAESIRNIAILGAEKNNLRHPNIFMKKILTPPLRAAMCKLLEAASWMISDTSSTDFLDKWLPWGRKWSVDCLSTWHISLRTNEGKVRLPNGISCTHLISHCCQITRCDHVILYISGICT